MINRISEHKVDLFIELPFRIQEIAKKLTKNREIEQKDKNLTNLSKKINFPARRFVNWVKLN